MNKKRASAEDRLLLGKICIAASGFESAVRFYRETFAEHPSVMDDLGSAYRFDAARAAVSASAGLGKGADPNLEEATRWRQEALEWLRADLRLMTRSSELGGPIPVPAIVQTLQRWRYHAHFAGVRGEAIDKLPPDERDHWRKLWADVDALLARHLIP